MTISARVVTSELQERGGAYVLTDLGSSNGTFLNDERIAAERRVTHGDCLQAGETRLTFLDDERSGGRGLVGKDVGGYRILERIGRGGMGTVYLANQVSLNRTVALKILSPRLASDPAFVKRFEAEARAAGRLNHPNIVQVYDVGSARDLHYFSMEYIENGSVQDMATREGVLLPDDALTIIIDATRGLEYAERKKLVHRDIKPDNLMINAEGVVKIADLGLARDAGEGAREAEVHQGEHHTDDEGIYGTPHFISPEQAQGRKVDTRSDIYSLGASFYRMVTGQTPFSGANIREIVQKQITTDPQPVRELNREVPAAMAQVIERMMRKDPADRFATASDLLEELLRIQGQMDRGAGGKRLILGGLLLALVASAGAWIALRSGGDRPEPPDPGPRNGGKTQAELEAELREREAREREARLNQARADLLAVRAHDVDQVKRDLEALEEILRRYQKVLDDYAGTDIAETIAGEAREPMMKVQAERDELDRAREAEAERIRQREEMARTALVEAEAAAKAAADDGRYGAALLALIELRDSGVLTGTDHAATLDSRIEAVAGGARSTADTALQAAAKLAEGRDFDGAVSLLREAADLLEEGLGSEIAARPRLGEIGSLAGRLRGQADTYVQAKIVKREDDLRADQAQVFPARRAALDIMARGVDPEAALAAVEKARAGAITPEWRALLDILVADLQGVGALLETYASTVRSGSDVMLRSSTDPGRLVKWQLESVTPTGINVKRGPYAANVRFAEFTPLDLAELLLGDVLPDTPANAANRARLHLLGGDPEKAQAASGPLRGDDASVPLLERIGREARAAELLAQVRGLEAGAEKDPKLYLEMLPLIEELHSRYRDTYVFARNSDGSTPVVQAPVKR